MMMSKSGCADVRHHHYPAVGTVSWLGLVMTHHQDSDLKHPHPHQCPHTLEMMQYPLQLNSSQDPLMLLHLMEHLTAAAADDDGAVATT